MISVFSFHSIIFIIVLCALLKAENIKTTSSVLFFINLNLSCIFCSWQNIQAWHTSSFKYASLETWCGLDLWPDSVSANNINNTAFQTKLVLYCKIHNTDSREVCWWCIMYFTREPSHFLSVLSMCVFCTKCYNGFVHFLSFVYLDETFVLSNPTKKFYNYSTILWPSEMRSDLPFIWDINNHWWGFKYPKCAYGPYC